VIIYVKNSIITATSSEILVKLNNERDFESAVTVISGEDGTLTTVICIYRSPQGDLKKFMDSLQATLLATAKKNTRLIVCGDYNVDLLSESVNKSMLLDLMGSFDLRATVTDPTNCTASSSTCIDNLFTNIDEEIATCTVTDLDLSDHRSLIFSVKEERTKSKKHEFTLKRNFSKKNTDKFKLLLYECRWDSVYNKSTVNDKYDAFTIIFKGAFDQAFPLMTR
jgi:Endonuclease-reverse transcriptase